MHCTSVVRGAGVGHRCNTCAFITRRGAQPCRAAGGGCGGGSLPLAPQQRRVWTDGRLGRLLTGAGRRSQACGACLVGRDHPCRCQSTWPPARPQECQALPPHRVDVIAHAADIGCAACQPRAAAVAAARQCASKQPSQRRALGQSADTSQQRCIPVPVPFTCQCQHPVQC